MENLDFSLKDGKHEEHPEQKLFKSQESQSNFIKQNPVQPTENIQSNYREQFQDQSLKTTI